MTFLAILCFAVSACKHTPAECQSCRSLPPEGEANLRIGSSLYKIPYWEDSVSYPTNRYWTGLYNGTTRNVQDLVDLLSLPKEEKVAAVVLYSSKFYLNGEQLEKRDIIGCQYYYVADNMLRHKFYYMHNGHMELVPSFNRESRGINYNDRFDLYNIYFKQQYPVVFAFDVADGSVKYTLPKSNEVSAAIKYYLRHQQSGGGMFKGTQVIVCAKPCANGPRACGRNAPFPESCDDDHGPLGPDASDAFVTASVQNGYQSQQDADITFNFPLQYLFRDSVMNNSGFGKKYINYYYNLTASAYLTPQIITQTIIVFNLFNPRMSWMISPDRFGDNIVIDNQFKTEASKLIELMKQAAPNATEQQYFIEAANDITAYQGMTVNQIIATLH